MFRLSRLSVPATAFIFFIFGASLLGQNSAAPMAGSSPAPGALQPIADTHRFNVRDFGATGDGKTRDTAAITRSIQAANRSGGGEVLFPPGIYLTGTFDLLSYVTLDLQPGAVLLGSSDVADYGDISAFGFDHNYGTSSSGEGNKVGMIVARGAVDIAIVGQGVIDGNSSEFFDFDIPHIGKDFDAAFTRNPSGFMAAMEKTESGPVEVKATGRPGTMIILSNCKNVVIRDVTLKDAPNWTLHLQNTENAIVSGLRVNGDLRIPNNDGMDCMHCRNVHVSDCNISTGDDDFAIVGSDNVSVANCALVSNSSGIRLEDTRDSTFSDLVIHANRGIGVYERGHGNTANVLFSNLVIESHLLSGHWWGKGEPILIASAGNATDGGVHDVRFSNIVARGESGILIYGTRTDSIHSIRFDTVKLTMQAPNPELASSVGGNFDLRWVATDHSNAVFRRDIAALYGHNIQDLQIKDFQVAWQGDLPEYFTSAFEIEDFQNLLIDSFSGRQAFLDSSYAVIELHHGKDISIRNSTAESGAGTFLTSTAMSGDGLFVNNDLAAAKRAFNASSNHFTAYGNRMPRQWQPQSRKYAPQARHGANR